MWHRWRNYVLFVLAPLVRRRRQLKNVARQPPPCSWNARTRSAVVRSAVLASSSAYRTTAEKVKAFVGQGGGCRATFFNYRKKLVSC
jgi:hypothetical protein